MDTKKIIIIAVIAAAAFFAYYIIINPTDEEKPGTGNAGAGGVGAGGAAGAAAGGSAGTGSSTGSTIGDLLAGLGTSPSPNSGLGTTPSVVSYIVAGIGEVKEYRNGNTVFKISVAGKDYLIGTPEFTAIWKQIALAQGKTIIN